MERGAPWVDKTRGRGVYVTAFISGNMDVQGTQTQERLGGEGGPGGGKVGGGAGT